MINLFVQYVQQQITFFQILPIDFSWKINFEKTIFFSAFSSKLNTVLINKG